MLLPSCSRERRRGAWRSALAALPLLFGLTGCESKQPAPAEPTPGAAKATEAVAESAKPTASFSGTVTGIVKLAPGASLPLAAPPQAAGGTKPATQPGCQPPSDADRNTVSHNPQTQGLFPAHVALTQMSAAPPRAPRTHDLFIENCRLTPGLVGAMVGDTLRVTNKSAGVFLPTLPGDAFMQAILAGKSREVKLNNMGPVTIQCGFAGYCGQSSVVTLAHSLYAVTDAEGRFKIEGVPLDQELQIHAWHPLFDVASAQVKLTAAESTKSVELVLAPTPTPAAPAPAPDAGAAKKKAGAPDKKAAAPVEVH